MIEIPWALFSLVSITVNVLVGHQSTLLGEKSWQILVVEILVGLLIFFRMQHAFVDMLHNFIS